MGILSNGIKYVEVMDDNELKKKSLEDNVYHTLRDIFANADEIKMCFEVNSYNSQLTDGVYFEDRTDGFDYTNALYKENFVKRLIDYLYKFHPIDLEFEPDLEPDLDMTKYITLDVWWEQFEELKNLLKKQYEKILQCRDTMGVIITFINSSTASLA